jgi:hypothetical protein
MEWQELDKEPLEDLISYINSKKDLAYAELAEAAFCTLTFRFRKDLIDKCVVMCRKRHLTEDDAIELANRVFERIWLYPNYKQEKCRNTDSNICFRKYLYGIANREIIGLQYPANSLYDGHEKIVTSLIDEEKDYDPEQLAKLKGYVEVLDNIFDKLTHKHKIIYFTYITYEKEGHNLPKHLLKQLKDTLGLSQSSIRVYKKQAYELVKKEIPNV